MHIYIYIVWIAVAGKVCGGMTGYVQHCSGIGWAHSNCAVVIAGGSCSDYCTGQGLACYASSDNRDGCVANADPQGRPGTPTTSNFCDATFGDQICVCTPKAVYPC